MLRQNEKEIKEDGRESKKKGKGVLGTYPLTRKATPA